MACCFGGRPKKAEPKGSIQKGPTKSDQTAESKPAPVKAQPAAPSPKPLQQVLDEGLIQKEQKDGNVHKHISVKEADSPRDYEQSQESNIQDTGDPKKGDRTPAANADGNAAAGIEPEVAEAANSSPSNSNKEGNSPVSDSPSRAQSHSGEDVSPENVDSGALQLVQIPDQPQRMRTVQEEEADAVGSPSEEQQPGQLQQRPQQQQAQEQQPAQQQPELLQPQQQQQQPELLQPQQQQQLEQQQPPQQAQAQASGELGAGSSLTSVLPSSPGFSSAPSGASNMSASLPYPAGSISSMLPPRGTASAILTGALPSQPSLAGSAWPMGLTGAPSPSPRPPSTPYSVPPPLLPPSTSPHAALLTGGLSHRFPATPAGYGALPPWPSAASTPTPTAQPRPPTIPPSAASTPSQQSTLPPTPLPPSPLSFLSSPAYPQSAPPLSAPSVTPTAPTPAGLFGAPASATPSAPNSHRAPSQASASPFLYAANNGLPAAPPAAAPLCVALQRPPMPPKAPSPTPSAAAHVKPIPDVTSASAPTKAPSPTPPPTTQAPPAPLGYAAKAAGSYAATAAAQAAAAAARPQAKEQRQKEQARTQQQQQQGQALVNSPRVPKATKQSKEMQALRASLNSNSGVASALQSRIPLSQRRTPSSSSSPATPSTPRGLTSSQSMQHHQSHHHHHHHHHHQLRNQRDAPGSTSDNMRRLAAEQQVNSRPMMPTAAAVRASQLQYEREQLRQLQREQREQREQGQHHPFLALPGGMSMRPGMSSASSRMAMTGLLSRRTSGFSTNASQTSERMSDRFSVVSDLEYRPRWR